MTRYTQGLLRLVAGFCFALHGAQKLFGAFHGTKMAMFSLLWVAGVIELTGGTLIFLGLFTRPVAFVLAGEMALAYFRQHFPKGFWPIENGGELAALYCFIFLFFAAAGPGGLNLESIVSPGHGRRR